MKPIYVSFYTTGNGYEEFAKVLLASFDKFGMERDVQTVTPFGSWLEAVRFKACFMSKMATKHSPRPVVWIDVDGVAHSDPTEYFTAAAAACDIGAHMWKNIELNSSVVLLSNTDVCRQAIDHWVELTARQEGVWEQRTLQQTVEHMWPKGLRFLNLPPQYCLITDAGRKYHPGVEPVLEFFQASRMLKNKAGQPGGLGAPPTPSVPAPPLIGTK